MISKELMKKMNTPRLLAYYKSKRAKTYQYFCDCCGMPLWDVDPKQYKALEAEYNQLCSEMDVLKAELATREHVHSWKKGTMFDRKTK